MTAKRPHESNTTDATVGQSLHARVLVRKAELEAAIGNPKTDEPMRTSLVNALSQVEGLLTGNLDKIPRLVAGELNTWLEASKHLDEHHRSRRA